MNQKKSALEHLAQAITEKKEWAPRAMRNHLSRPEVLEVPFLGMGCESMKEALASAFDWADASEGLDYWMKAYRQIEIEEDMKSLAGYDKRKDGTDFYN
jgi:hypothetical protein